MSAAVELRPFTQADWDGLAGAERFPDGSEPLIWEGDASALLRDAPADAGAVLVLDAAGLSVMVYGADGELLDAFLLPTTLEEARATVKIVAAYPPTVAQLGAVFGFERIV